ncbi:FkbM family methyltransferase [Tropicibacter sp. Alg240-R139]|uniref:FkbM family methyltransferase n=1 Tax=Tropicibacter sp. Alg240-R139 TaxID=2305991 RepID=UPI0013DE87DB|nr:FkbM family methyltransferase [Tropicibacter sp. Alg240-R139]
MLTKLRKMVYRARGYYAGTLNGEPFRLDPYHSKFWRKASAGTWEPETFSILDRHLNAASDYLDIGAWIGPTVLYGARKARRVMCFEPDPVALRHLLWNLELNDIRNVSAFGVALSDSFGVTRMASMHGEAGDSTSSLLNDGTHGTDALTISWDQFAGANDLSRVSLVKMDIEGAEYGVLPSLLPWLKEHRPTLYLSTHAPYLDESTRVEQTRQLMSSLSFYDSCTDDTGEAVKPEDWTSPQVLSSFRSYLFKA